MRKLFRVSSPEKNILFYEFSNQYYLTSTFMRLQEFYESPFKNICGKYFTTEEFMDTYANNKDDNTFSYYTDWSGFNVPGNVVRDFMSKFRRKLTRREQELITDIDKRVKGDKFYVVGAVEDNYSTLEHEVCHALYYMYPSFKRAANSIIDNTDILTHAKKKEICDVLLEKGYSKAVLKDELNAYLSTKDKIGLHMKFKVKIPQKVLTALSENFTNFKKKIEEES